MRVRNLACFVSSVFSLALFFTIANSSFGQIFTENFDDANADQRWTAHAGILPFEDPNSLGFTMDTGFDRSPVFPGADGINDNFDDFAFDYSIHGIPTSPNSSDPNSTIGMRLRANNFTGIFGGFSVSPTNLDITVEDYSVKFDLWSSTIGPFPAGGTSSTMLSTYGILTNGTASQVPGGSATDGVYFANTGDAGSGADWRIYSAARTFSHQLNSDPNTGGDFLIDNQATYLAGTRNALGQINYDAIGDPNRQGVPVPESVQLAVETLYGDPNGDPNTFIMRGVPGFFDPNGEPQAAVGFAWREMEIRKVGNQIDMFMNGVNLLRMDITDWFDPNTPFNDPNSNGSIDPNALGTNISFGHADINAGGPSTTEAWDLVYTLIDNVVVEEIVFEDPDFDDNGRVDAADFLILQRGSSLPADGTATNADGDANDDGFITSADFAIWESFYGQSFPVTTAVSVVPEPSTLASWALFSLFSLFGYRPCRQGASRH